MIKKNKKKFNLVQGESDLDGLSYIASKLNKIGELQGEELSAWKEGEDILEAMTDQPGRDSIYKKEPDRSVGTFLTMLSSRYREPNRQPIPLPQYAINTFNRWAMENPVRLQLRRGESGIEAGHQSTTESGSVLCVLWEFYFHKERYKKLKRCPECRLWFVDDTKNTIKSRCSRKCTNRWWSREFRKKLKPKFQRCQRCEGKFSLMYRFKGILQKRKQCPHCGFEIEPKKRKLEKIYCAIFPRKPFYNDELCPYEQDNVPDPSKVCAVKCGYYKKSKFSKTLQRHPPP